MSVPLHSKFRRKIKQFFNSVIVKVSNQSYNDEKIQTSSIKRVLLIRVNYRIGNIVFMTPLIRALQKKLPDAKIDMIVGAKFTAPIIEGMSNVEHVYDLPRKLLKEPIKLFNLIKEINANDYDLIISPVNGSASSNLTVLLLKAKIKLGFYNADTWSPINRMVLADKSIVHEALKPLALMNIFSGDILKYNQFLDVDLSLKEREEGRMILSDLLLKNSFNRKDFKIIGIFRDARYEKKIPQDWWIEFIRNMQDLDDSIVFIDILNPNEMEPLIKDMLFISSKNLRDLAKIFSALDIFLCGDTGPMHLASASLTPIIAFFNVTNPELYGPLGENDKAILIKDKDINLVAKETYNSLTSIVV